MANTMITKTVQYSFILLFCVGFLSAKPFVEGAIFGQLGNQMFQVAAAVGVARDNDAEPIFPRLKISRERNAKLNLKHVFWRLSTKKMPRKVRFWYPEIAYYYVKIPYQPDMSMAGFFQSEKYFKNYKDEVLELFAPHKGIVEYLEGKYLHILQHPNTVAVHVRTYFPDFPDGNDILTFLGWDYFEEMISTFPNNCLFVICSDRIDLCKKHLSHIDRELIFIEDNHHYEDLYLMSFCKHNIISNSSFSWWAAYLNRNPEKIVIAPSPWFGVGGSDRNTKDLLPEEWITFER